MKVVAWFVVIFLLGVAFLTPGVLEKDTAEGFLKAEIRGVIAAPSRIKHWVYTD